MALLWQQVTYVQLTAAATFGGWYLTWTACHWILSCFVVLGGMFIQCLLVLIIRRHAQILEEFTRNLHRTNLIDQDKSLVGAFGMTSHGLARYACAFFVFAGALIIAGTIADQRLQAAQTRVVILVTAGLMFITVYVCRNFFRMILKELEYPIKT